MKSKIAINKLKNRKALVPDPSSSNKIRVVGAYGLHEFSPMEVSDNLTALRTSHLIYSQDSFLRVNRIFSYEQPAIPVIIDTVGSISRFYSHAKLNVSYILFILDSRTVIANCNLGIINRIDNVKDALIYSVKNPLGADWELNHKKQSIEDILKIAVKQSVLTDVQTAIYKITPYDLRKSIQALVIDYLANKCSITRLNDKLKSSHKFDDLRLILKNPKIAELRLAVARTNKGENLEVVCKEHNFETFELLYVLNSAKKAALTK